MNVLHKILGFILVLMPITFFFCLEKETLIVFDTPTPKINTRPIIKIEYLANRFFINALGRDPPDERRITAKEDLRKAVSSDTALKKKLEIDTALAIDDSS